MLKRIFGTILLTVFAAGFALAQSPSVFTTGLQLPTKIITAGQSHLLVAETGFANNNGRVSLIDRSTGVRRTLIDGLPSGFNAIEQTRSGASGIRLRGLKLYLTFGQGDSAVPGSRGGAVPNPSPITPLNNSILELTLPADYEVLVTNFSLSISDQKILAAANPVILQNTEGKILNVRLVANLPDYKVENRPGFPQGNVRPANIFGIELAGGSLFAVDASFNQLYKINPATGEFGIFSTFGPVPNPLPFGPPVSEAVPDSVRLYGDKLLVTQLTGFPFAPGTAVVKNVDLQSGEQTVRFNDLTSVMDVLPVPIFGSVEGFFVLEFSTNMRANPSVPGRLLLFSTGNPTLVILTDLVSPTSMARDGETGDLYITEIFPGRIIRLTTVFDRRLQTTTE